MEVGLREGVRGDQAVAHGDVEEFLAAAEHGVPSSGSGDLGFGAGSEGHNVDFGAAGFVREIGQPAAIGGEATVVLAGGHVGGGGRLEDLAVAG